MSLYEYMCQTCGYEFEELINNKEDNLFISCKKCGNDAERKMSTFLSVVEGSSNESIDKKIGREANKRWQMHYDQQSKRRSDKELQNFKLPKVEGKYTPVMALGNKKDKKKRKEYSTALQEHRQDREKKGQRQFSESGPF